MNEFIKALNERQSIRKNGDTWPDYFTKVITPGRVMWIVLAAVYVVQAIWVAGTQFRDVQVRLEASDATADIVKGLEENTKKQGELTAELAGTIEALMVENAALASTAKGLNDRVMLTITRGEFQRVVQLQLIPRLEKIEKAQTSAAAFSGEK